MTSFLIASSGGFWAPIANPIASVLAFFYTLVPNYGVAIVMLTIAMMIVLVPLTIKQTRSMLVMQKLQPEMKRLQEQHKNDRQALNEAVMALYKEHNASPLGGCVPMLLPFPLFFALYRVLEGLSHLGHQGKAVVSQPEYLSRTTKMYQDIKNAHGKLDSFGLDLSKTARNAGGGFAHSLPYFVLLLLMVGTQFYQQYQLTSKNPAMKNQPGQAMMMKVIPLVFGVISLAFPAGLIVYWTVSNIFRIGQQWAMYRYDPKVKALVSQDIKEVEAKTRDIDAAEKQSRPRFRDLFANAKTNAQSSGRTGTDKGAPGRSTSPGGAKKSGSTPAKAGGAQKSSPQKSGSPKPAVAKGSNGKSPGAAAGAAKAPAAKAAPKPGAPKPGAQKPGAQKPGAAKPGAAKPGAPQPGPARTTPAKGGPVTPTKAGAGRPAGSGPGVSAGNSSGLPKTSTAETSTAAAGGGSRGGGPGVGAAIGNGATAMPNGRSKAADEGQDLVESGADEGADGATATPINGSATTNGAPKGRTGAGRTGAGRTGAGNARTISGNRRRKGR